MPQNVSNDQGLSEKFGGPGQIFVSGALFFSKMLASGGEDEHFFRTLKKRVKKFFWPNISQTKV
jgi:hypothetical protein